MATTTIGSSTFYAEHVVELMRRLPVEKQARVAGYVDSLAEDMAEAEDDALWGVSFANTPDSLLDAFIAEARESHASATLFCSNRAWSPCSWSA